MTSVEEHLIMQAIIILVTLLWKWSHEESAWNAFLVWVCINLCFYGPILIVAFIVWGGGHIPI